MGAKGTGQRGDLQRGDALRRESWSHRGGESGAELWGCVGGPSWPGPFPPLYPSPLQRALSFPAPEKQFPIPKTSPDIYIEAASRNFLENSFSAHSHFKGKSKTPKAGGLCGFFRVASGKLVWWEQSTEEDFAPGQLGITDLPLRRGEARASVSRKMVGQAFTCVFTFLSLAFVPGCLHL